MNYNNNLINMKYPLSRIFIIYNKLMKEDLQENRNKDNNDNNDNNEQYNKDDYQMILTLRNYCLEIFDMCNVILKKI